MSTLVHAENDAPVPGSVKPAQSRRPVRRAPDRRTAPPSACTSSAAVDEHALAPAMAVRLRAERQAKILKLLLARVTDPVQRKLLAECASETTAILHEAASMAKFLDGPLTALRVAERRRDWDVLGMHAFTSARAQARELIPLLDTILEAEARRDYRTLSATRARLAPWFDVHGDSLVRPLVLTEVGAVLRAPTLLREYRAWSGAGATA